MFQRTRQAEAIRTQIYAADERMLDTLGVRLVEGRAFTRDDVLRNTEQLRALNATDARPRRVGHRASDGHGAGDHHAGLRAS